MIQYTQKVTSLSGREHEACVTICHSITEYLTKACLDCTTFSADCGLFYGFDDHKASRQRLRDGADSETLAAAKAMLNRIKEQIPATPRKQLRRSPYGYRANIGQIVTDGPFQAKIRRKQSSERGAVRIYIDASGAAGINAKQMHNRAAALAALVARLKTKRPVEVYAYVALSRQVGDAGFIAAKVDTQPFNLAHAIVQLGHQGLWRGFGYGFLRVVYGCGSHWEFECIPQPKKMQKDDHAHMVRQAFRMKKDDVLIGGIALDDSLVNNPVEWVEKMLAALSDD